MLENEENQRALFIWRLYSAWQMTIVTRNLWCNISQLILRSLSSLVDFKRFNFVFPLQSSYDNTNEFRYLMVHTSESLFVLSWSVFSDLTMNKYGKYTYTKLRRRTLETVQAKSCCWLPSIKKVQEKHARLFVKRWALLFLP